MDVQFKEELRRSVEEAFVDKSEDGCEELLQKQSLGSRVLWIDAICIDQNNISEQTDQVRHMKHIYTSADRVLIWLGSSDADIDVVMRALREQAVSGLLFPPNDEMIVVALRAGIEKLVMKLWFYRIWTVRELLVDGQRHLVGCGQHWIT